MSQHYLADVVGAGVTAAAPSYVPVALLEHPEATLAVHEGYHVGCSVTLTGGLMSLGTGLAVHSGAMALCPFVMGKYVASGLETALICPSAQQTSSELLSALTTTGTSPPVWTLKFLCPMALKNAAMTPEWAVMLMNVRESVANISLRARRRRRVCCGEVSW